MENQKINWTTCELEINEFNQSKMVERAFYGEYNLYRVTVWTRKGRKFCQAWRICKKDYSTVFFHSEDY